MSPAGGELVVMRAVRLQHLYDVTVLTFEGDCHRRAVQVVQESSVSKHIQEMTRTLSRSLPAGQEQRCLTLVGGGKVLNLANKHVCMR